MPAAPTCAACFKLIESGSIITFGDGQKYHGACFKCGGCKTSLLESTNGGGGLHSHGGKPFCSACWTKNFAERCGACNKPFIGQERVIVFEGKKMHPACFRCSGPCGEPLPGKFMKGTTDGKPYCSTCYANAFAPRCDKCNKPIAADGERYVIHKGKKLHKHCFCCAACNMSLANMEHYERDGNLYCAEDYKNHFGMVCAVCDARLLKWLTCPTGDTYCQRHEGECPPCHGCGRLVAPSSGGVDLNDGRVSCKFCAATAINSLDEAKKWYRRVVAFLQAQGLPNLPAPEQVRLQLCERSEILARNRQHISIAHHQAKCPVGLTSAEEMHTLDGGSGRLLERTRMIGAVSVLKGLPAEMCSATIAHEIGHVYMHLAGFDSNLPPALAEGMCELFSYLWLTSKDCQSVLPNRDSISGSSKKGASNNNQNGSSGGGGGSGKQQQQQDVPFRVKAMMDSKDAIYGQGFRDALAAYYSYDCNLPKLLEGVKSSRRLPPSNPLAASRAAMRANNGGQMSSPPPPPPQQQQPAGTAARQMNQNNTTSPAGSAMAAARAAGAIATPSPPAMPPGAGGFQRALRPSRENRIF